MGIALEIGVEFVVWVMSAVLLFLAAFWVCNKAHEFYCIQRGVAPPALVEGEEKANRLLWQLLKEDDPAFLVAMRIEEPEPGREAQKSLARESELLMGKYANEQKEWEQRKQQQSEATRRLYAAMQDDAARFQADVYHAQFQQMTEKEIERHLKAQMMAEKRYTPVSQIIPGKLQAGTIQATKLQIPYFGPDERSLPWPFKMG